MNMVSNINTGSVTGSLGLSRLPEDVATRTKVANTEPRVDLGVSTNEYGDEFRRSSVVNNEDGVVYNKPKNYDGDEVQARVPEGEELPRVDSLIGYTASQVEQFYYEGRISRYDYDVKMKQKEEFFAKGLPTSDTKNNDSRDAQSTVGAADEAKAAYARDIALVEDSKKATVKAVESEESDKKAATGQVVRDEQQVEANSSDIQQKRAESKKELLSEAEARDKVFNAEMSAINNEQRSDEEFEIIESGVDPMKAWTMIQDLNNLGSRAEGEAWNIA